MNDDISYLDLGIDKKVLAYDEVVVAVQEQDQKRPIVLIGAIDIGREELQNKLLATDGNRFAVPVPVTTRAPRHTDDGQLKVDGCDFHLVSLEQFKAEIAANRFADYGEFDGELHGTRFESVRRVVQAGQVAILIAHVEAIQALYESDVKPFFVFVTPPKTLYELRALRIKLGATRIVVCMLEIYCT